MKLPTRLPMQLTGGRPAAASPSEPALGPRFSSAGLVLGTLFVALSLTPSLVPRSVVVQGVVSGLSLSLGYLIGRVGAWIWRYLELPQPSGRTHRIMFGTMAALCALTIALFLARATHWQNSVRALMGMEPVSGVRPVSVGLLTLTMYLVLHFVGWQLRRMALHLSHRFKRVVPRRIAGILGTVAAVLLFWGMADGVVFAYLLRLADRSYQQLDAAITEGQQPPTDSLRAGSAASLIDWHDLGKRGRAFVSSGPSAEQITAFHGAPALEPIRVYIGLNAAETSAERAELALRELIRVKAFDRALLLLVTPTGTGWVDPASLIPLEYMHRGNIATVAAQYSYLPSALSLLTEGAYGEETARALFEAVYGHWTTLPRDRRPRLYLHGLSLGALNSDLSFDLYDVLRDPFHGALWVGPPFRSPSWRRATASRVTGTPAWLPRFRDGSVVRFSNQNGGLHQPPGPWGPLRIAYLQYASDPVTFFTPTAFHQEPDWMRPPRGPDVSPLLRWYPVVTGVQLAADLAAGVEATPLGFGHNFAPAHYIEAWSALTDPVDWSAAHNQRLAQLFADYRRRD